MMANRTNGPIHHLCARKQLQEKYLETFDFNSQKMGSNSKQIALHRRKKDADLEHRVQEMKVSPAIPPGKTFEVDCMK